MSRKSIPGSGTRRQPQATASCTPQSYGLGSEPVVALLHPSSRGPLRLRTPGQPPPPVSGFLASLFLVGPSPGSTGGAGPAASAVTSRRPPPRFMPRPRKRNAGPAPQALASGEGSRRRRAGRLGPGIVLQREQCEAPGRPVADRQVRPAGAQLGDLRPRRTRPFPPSPGPAAASPQPRPLRTGRPPPAAEPPCSSPPVGCAVPDP